MHEEETSIPNSTIVVLGNVNLGTSTTTTTATIGDDDNILSAPSPVPSTHHTQYFFSTTSDTATTTNILRSNGTTILIDGINANSIIVSNALSVVPPNIIMDINNESLYVDCAASTSESIPSTLISVQPSSSSTSTVITKSATTSEDQNNSFSDNTSQSNNSNNNNNNNNNNNINNNNNNINSNNSNNNNIIDDDNNNNNNNNNIQNNNANNKNENGSSEETATPSLQILNNSGEQSYSNQNQNENPSINSKETQFNKNDDEEDDDDDDTSRGYTDNGTQHHTSQDAYVPSLLPPVGNVINTCDQTDLKYYFEELCPVCGDKVSGYHYGLLTCESCKGFFKRTVQNKKVYTCVAERQCHIDKTQRKRCPYCRFQKCLDVGMKLEAVRADRMRGGRNKFGPMYKRDRARKLQIMRQRQLAVQALRAAEGNTSQLSPTGYQQSYSNMNIKQEIQIPQISSLTSSPDSSPSPIAIALGQVSVTSASGTSTTISGAGSSAANNASGTGDSNLVGNNSGLSATNSSNNATASASTISNPTTDSKLWFANSTTASPHSLSPKAFSFDTGTNPTSTADLNTVEPLSKKQYWKNSKSLNFPRVSPMIREFVQSVDDREWQTQLFSLLQSQSYNQCEVDLFELMCKVLDQNLFSQVDWARNTIFFKDLKVDDQMKLLQNSWSDMLVLDHLHHRLHNNLPDETPLHNGQKFDLLGLGLLGVPQLADHFNEIQNKLQELKFDVGDYICMKFLLLLNPDVRGITNRKTVLEGYENVQAALLDYTLTCYPSVEEKFAKLLSIIPEIHDMAARGEDHLYLKHCAGSAPTQTLLMEMLHAKRK